MTNDEILQAAKDVGLTGLSFVLSASLLERIYLAMRDKADGRDSAGWDAYEDLRKASDEMVLNLRQRVQELEKQRDELLAALERCRFALEPYDDIKPRDWKSDRLNLRDAHQVAVAAIASVKGEQ